MDLPLSSGRLVKPPMHKQRNKHGTERRIFSEDFKRNAVALVSSADRPKAEIAKELGIRGDQLNIEPHHGLFQGLERV